MWIPTLKETDQPIYMALVDAIADAIESGELKVGDRLPPQRRLAWKLGLNPSTTMQAYREAARRHLVSGEVGRGTYVLEGSKESSLFLIKNHSDSKTHIDLSVNVPAIEINNHDTKETLLKLAQSDRLAAENYLTPEAITLGQSMAAKWLALRGVNCQPANVKLCAGAQQGILAVLLSFCYAGDPVLVEELTAPGIKAVGRQLHLPLYGVPLDEKGIIPEEFDRLIRTTGAKVVVLTPVLQNPTGSVMDRQRKAELVEVILKHQLIVLEDDIYGALSDEPPLYNLLPDNCLLVTSFSKTVSAGLRLGYIAGNKKLLAQVDPDAQMTSWAVSPLSLAVACEWIADGTAQARLRWQQTEVVQRWRLAYKIVGRYMQNTHQPGPHIWLKAPFPQPELAKLCVEVGVEVVPADVFAVRKQHLNAIRISLTAAKSQVELKIALEAIAAVLEKQQVRPG